MTDAAVVLGYIDPGYFLGGKLALDAAAAHRAVERAVAEPLGFSVQRAAWAILTVANEHMVGAIREITINQGIDPRESIVVAGGGAGGLTMSTIADELGCDKVLVPQTAAALSATGGLLGDVVAEFTVSRRADTNAFDRDAVNEGLADLDRQIEAFFAQHGRPRRRAHAGLRGRGALPVPGVGARRGPALQALREPGRRRRAGRGVPRDARARLRGQGARPVASSACTGRAARACTCHKPTLAAATGDGRQARRAPSRARCGGAATTRSRRPCSSARRCRPASASPGRRSSSCRPRPSSSIPAGRRP